MLILHVAKILEYLAHNSHNIKGKFATMNKWIVIMMLMLSTKFLSAQQSAIASAFKAGDAKAITALAESNIDITIANEESTYSVQQATIVLASFFAEHKVISYTSSHEGSSATGSIFQIGNLVTTMGSYKVYVYCKIFSGKTTIQEIRLVPM